MEFIVTMVSAAATLACNPLTWLVGLLTARGGAQPLWRYVGTVTASLVSVLLLLKASGDPTGMSEMLVGSLFSGVVVGFACSFFKRSIVKIK